MRAIVLVAERECDQCREAKAVLGRLAEQFPGLEVQVLRTIDAEAAPYGVVMSPTVILDNMIVASGRAPNERKLAAYLTALPAAIAPSSAEGGPA